MKILNVPNFEAFDELYRKYKHTKDSDELKNLLLLFVAANDSQTNESWCSDCRNSKTVLENKIEEYKFNEQLALAIVQVGQRDEWKKSDNPFRVHELQVGAVPTLLSLKTGLRLVEAECADAAKVSHLFSNSL